MDKQPHKLKKQKSKFLAKASKKDLIIGSIIATFIAITPYLFTLWEGVPNQETWDTFFGTYNSGYYLSAQILVWTLLGKIIPLLLLIIWMFTNKHWWYHVLIVPIVMYIYQIITILNDDLEFSENNQILYLLPVMAIIIPSIYLLRARMTDKIDEATKTMEELEEELMAKPKGLFGRFSDYF
jgi:magnesium-transporting ATPase (P-type)